jgi:hypothetical protein
MVMMSKTVLGYAGVAEIAGDAVHVQVVGESDRGRLVVQEISTMKTHVIERRAFVDDLAVAPEPISDEVRTAAITLSQAVERARAMAGQDGLLGQEDYQVLLGELDETDQYPFASALLEHGVSVRTGRRAAVDVLTDPHEGDDPSSKSPEPWQGPGGAGEAQGAGADTDDQPGFYPWDAVDRMPSNEHGTTEHDFPGVREIEGERRQGAYSSGTETVVVFTTVGNKSKRHLATCPMVERLRNRGMKGRFVILTEQEAVDEQLEERGYPISNCACVKGMPLPLWDAVDFDEETEASLAPQEKDAEFGWSGTELVDERWAQASMQDLIDSPRGRPEDPVEEGAKDAVEDLPGAPKVSRRRAQQPGIPREEFERRQQDMWEDEGGQQRLDLDPRPAPKEEKEAQQGNCTCPEPTVTIEHPTPCRVCGGNVPEDWGDLDVEADLTSPSGRDRGLNPSVHEQIGDAYRSDNQWEDPDMHLGSATGSVKLCPECAAPFIVSEGRVYATLRGGDGHRVECPRRADKPGSPAIPAPYGPDIPLSDDLTMFDDLDADEGSVVQHHASGDGDVGIAGDKFEPEPTGDGVDSNEDPEDKEPFEFGVLAVRDLLAQGVDNRQSDPNVQTNVDEQQDDRAIDRPPAQEGLRYSVRRLIGSACQHGVDENYELVTSPAYNQMFGEPHEGDEIVMRCRICGAERRIDSKTHRVRDIPGDQQRSAESLQQRYAQLREAALDAYEMLRELHRRDWRRVPLRPIDILRAALDDTK